MTSRAAPTHRSSLARGSAKAVRGSVIPVIQLGAAALTLGLWLVVNQQVSSSFEVLAVEVFTYSAVLALTLTAGIPYVLPNLFRAADRATWSGRGPWSTPVALAVAVNRGCAAAGAVLAVVALPLPGMRVPAASLAAAAALSTAILAAQLARLQEARWGMAAALSPNPFIPSMFLVLHAAGVSTGMAVVVFCVAAVALDEAILRRYRPVTVPLADLDRAAARSVMRSAGPLIPHLLCFAAIMQGPRLAEALHGSAAQLVASHQVMLLVTIGTTVVTSFHGYISVSLQSTPEEAYGAKLRLFGLQYAGIGAVAGAAVAFLLVVVAPRAITDFPQLSWPGRLAVIAALPTISTYYALSAQVVRSGRTVMLAAVSASTLALYALVEVALPASTSSATFGRYAACLLALPLLLWAISAIVDPPQRGPLARLLGTAALGFAPVGVLLVVWAVASGIGGR